MNKHSYRYELITNEKGMFDNYIDMVYILTLEDCKRREHYMNQIKTYLPHKNILIQHNKGYKKCKKQLYQQSSLQDLNDAYYHAFLHSLKHNYKNIIILEDDFIFDHNINQYIVNDIGNFIKNNKYHIYHLGNLFGINIPTYSTHIRTLLLVLSHAAIYNIDYSNFYIKKYENNIDIANDLVWNDINIIKYTYYKPLCFQLLPHTENRNTWSTGKIFIPIIEFLKIDKIHTPGYTVLNILSFIVSFIILFIFIIISSFIYKL